MFWNFIARLHLRFAICCDAREKGNSDAKREPIAGFFLGTVELIGFKRHE